MNIEVFASRVDLLGALAFLYIIVYSIAALAKKRNIMNYILLLIGIIGFLVDAFITVNTYF